MGKEDPTIFHTKQSKIVQDVADLVIPKIPVPIYASGGLAGVQAYLPSGLCRKSSDLDFSLVHPVRNNSEFESIFSNATDNLVRNEYNLTTKRQRATFDLVVYKDNDSILIQVPRRNRQNYFSNKETLRREYTNSQRKKIGSEECLVSDPADIVVRKLRRMEALVKKSKYFSNEDNFRKNAETDLRFLLKEVENARINLIANATDTDIAGKSEAIYGLRILSDIFDIRALDEEIGLDRRILNEGIQSLDAPKKEYAINAGRILINGTNIYNN